MKKTIAALLIAFSCLAASSALQAQTPAMPSGPPKVLQIFVEQLKVGKGPAHEKNESGWPRAFAAAKSPTYYVAMTTQTGSGEVWFVSGFDSMAAMEKDVKSNEKDMTLTASMTQLGDKDSEFLTGARGILANFRDDLSYKAGSINIWQMRYFLVTTIRVRPGHGNEYIEAAKMYREAHEKANIPEEWAVYQVQAGLPDGTFMIFQPLKSLSEVDAFTETHGKAYQDAMGDDGRRKVRELNAASMVSSETTLLSFSPKMSYVSKEVAGADADYWMPKPTSKAAPTAMKEGEKPKAKP